MGIRDVAKLARVSTATVSRVITGAARVAPITATRVLHAMETLDFKPNEAARVLAIQKKLKKQTESERQGVDHGAEELLQ